MKVVIITTEKYMDIANVKTVVNAPMHTMNRPQYFDFELLIKLDLVMILTHLGNKYRTYSTRGQEGQT
jgi:hypothetical protein